ncbi:thiol oxidoreductase [Amphritea opalescens]|uniref:Thiol oxidoreductase n=2 Tax=Amphritea opalescens TaxID=2490544 RepID=A0A430KQ71_9GAMM|nr:thiol oxidoreductase [Amphritea opalescens]
MLALLSTSAPAAEEVDQLAIYTPGEERPGGETSHRKPRDRHVFSQPSANMSFADRLSFGLGDSLFDKIWVPSPSSTTASDGLGPLYNARSCDQCHQRDGRGQPKANWPEALATSLFLRLSIPPQTDTQRQQLKRGRIGAIPDPTYGIQLQNRAINGLDAEGHMQITYTESQVSLADGTQVSLRKPTYHISELKYGPLHSQIMLSPRLAPPMLGLGLLEAIPDSAIMALSDPDDLNGDGISGRPNWVWDQQQEQLAIGRFGWKAGNPSVLQQTVSALSHDIGIGTPYQPSPYGDCTVRQTACLAQPEGNTPQQDNSEASAELVELLVFYSRNLAPPVRPDAQQPEVLRGKAIFQRSGCSNCHQPSFETPNEPNLAEQSAQQIWPYTDLLLHDMGEGLADHRPEYSATGREWKTPPLWGIGLTNTVNGHQYFLHDGRARTLLEAILWHGGEAANARQKVINLATSERHALITFLESL